MVGIQGDARLNLRSSARAGPSASAPVCQDVEVQTQRYGSAPSRLPSAMYPDRVAREHVEQGALHGHVERQGRVAAHLRCGEPEACMDQRRMFYRR